jgi:hypothetical protein
MMRGAVLVLALTLVAPEADAAGRSPPVARAPDIICVTVATRWGGGEDAVRHIRERPVPDSYRRLYAWTGCQNLMKGTLVDWHLAFGDEATTTAALSFLEQTAMDGMVTPDAFAKALPHVWSAAQPDGAKAQALFDKRDWNGGRAALDASKAVGRLRPLATGFRRYFFLAGEYQRAAEFYGSAALAAKARTYLAPVVLGLKILYGDAAVSMQRENPQIFNQLGIGSDEIDRIQDLSLRAAVLDARIERDAATLAAAEAALDAYADTIPEKAVDIAYAHGDDFCDAGSSATPDFIAACRNEHDFARRVARYWVARANFDMLAAGQAATQSWTTLQGPADSFSTAVRLTEKGQEQYAGEPPRYDDAIDTLAALRIAKADMEAAQAGLIDKQGREPSNLEARQLRSEALADLSRAASLVPPDLHPGRFRQIARRYLDIHAEQAERRDRDTVPSAPEERAASFFRVNLNALDRIAAAE